MRQILDGKGGVVEMVRMDEQVAVVSVGWMDRC